MCWYIGYKLYCELFFFSVAPVLIVAFIATSVPFQTKSSGGDSIEYDADEILGLTRAYRWVSHSDRGKFCYKMLRAILSS